MYMTHYILALHIDNLQKLIKQNHPWTYKEDKEWAPGIDANVPGIDANVPGIDSNIPGTNTFNLFNISWKNKGYLNLHSHL